MAAYPQFRGALTLAAASMAALVGLAPVAGATVVLSNGIAGDLFTNPGPSNTGQAIGATGWVCTTLRVDGEVGISGDDARSGNGSARLATRGVAALCPRGPGPDIGVRAARGLTGQGVAG